MSAKFIGKTLEVGSSDFLQSAPVGTLRSQPDGGGYTYSEEFEKANPLTRLAIATWAGAGALGAIPAAIYCG